MDLDEVAGGEFVVVQREPRAAAFVADRDHDAGAARGEGLPVRGGLLVQDVLGGFVVGPGPGECQTAGGSISVNVPAAAKPSAMCTR